MAFAKPRVISVFFSPCWLLLMAFFTLSVLNAADPSAAARAAFFTVIGIVTIVAVLALPRDADSFSATLAFAGITVVVVSYIGVVLLPGVAIHTAEFGGTGACRAVARPVRAQEPGRTGDGLLQLRRALSHAARLEISWPVSSGGSHDLHGQHRLQDHSRPGAAHHHDRRAARPDRHAAARPSSCLRWPSSEPASRRLASSSSIRSSSSRTPTFPTSPIPGG